MTAIIDKLNQVYRLQNYAVVAVRLALMDNVEFIEELNRNQLEEGQRSDGSSMPDYSQTSVSVFGKRPGPIQLFDEGDFYEGINANIFDDEMRFEGEDEKTAMLMSKYGDMTLGLTDENRQILIDRIRPAIIDLIRKFYKSI